MTDNKAVIAVNTSVTNVTDNIEEGGYNCGICYNTFRLPFVFDCGHSFCVSCTALHLQQKHDCALCRCPTGKVVPNYSLRQLLRDDDKTVTEEEKVWLNSIVEQFPVQSTTSTEEEEGAQAEEMRSEVGHYTVGVGHRPFRPVTNSRPYSWCCQNSPAIWLSLTATSAIHCWVAYYRPNPTVLEPDLCYVDIGYLC